MCVASVTCGPGPCTGCPQNGQSTYELYNCFAVFEPRSPGLVCMTHFLDLLKHNDVAAREEVV